MSKAGSVLAVLACVAAVSSGCTTTYTEADLPKLEEEAAVHEDDDVARQKQLIQEGGQNDELLEDQERWLDAESDR